MILLLLAGCADPPPGSLVTEPASPITEPALPSSPTSAPSPPPSPATRTHASRDRACTRFPEPRDTMKDAILDRVVARVPGTARPLPFEIEVYFDVAPIGEIVERGDPHPGTWRMWWYQEPGRWLGVEAHEDQPTVTVLYDGPEQGRPGWMIADARREWRARVAELGAAPALDPDPDRVRRLSVAATDPDPRVRGVALAMMAQFAPPFPPGWAGPITAGLASADTSIRAAAVAAAAASRDPALATGLGARACDPAASVRYRALSALPPDALAPWLLDADPAVACRAAALAAEAAPVSVDVGPVCTPAPGTWRLELWSPALATEAVSVRAYGAGGDEVGRGAVPASADWTGEVALSVTAPPTRVALAHGAAEEELDVSPVRGDTVFAFCAAPAPPPSGPLGAAWRHVHADAGDVPGAPDACLDAASAVARTLPVDLLEGLIRRRPAEAARALLEQVADRSVEVQRTVLGAWVGGRSMRDPLPPEVCAWVVPAAVRVDAEDLAREMQACIDVDPALAAPVYAAVADGRWPAGTLRLPAAPASAREAAARRLFVDGDYTAWPALAQLAGLTNREGIQRFDPPLGDYTGVLLVSDWCATGEPGFQVVDAVVLLGHDGARPERQPRVVPLIGDQPTHVRAAVCGARKVWGGPRR